MNQFGDEPNTNVCPVCLGLPGSLPVVNEKAVTYAMQIGRALNCSVNRSVFARKYYFYPDMPKDYQISQYELPIVSGGQLKIQVDHQEKIIGIPGAMHHVFIDEPILFIEAVKKLINGGETSD